MGKKKGSTKTPDKKEQVEESFLDSYNVTQKEIAEDAAREVRTRKKNALERRMHELETQVKGINGAFNLKAGQIAQELKKKERAVEQISSEWIQKINDLDKEFASKSKQIKRESLSERDKLNIMKQKIEEIKQEAAQQKKLAAEQMGSDLAKYELERIDGEMVRKMYEASNIGAPKPKGHTRDKVNNGLKPLFTKSSERDKLYKERLDKERKAIDVLEKEREEALKQKHVTLTPIVKEINEIKQGLNQESQALSISSVKSPTQTPNAHRKQAKRRGV